MTRPRSAPKRRAELPHFIHMVYSVVNSVDIIPGLGSQGSYSKSMSPLWQQDCIFPRHPEEPDMETKVLAVTVPYANELTASSLPEKQLRRITFNGKPLTSQQQRCLESLELSLGLRLPDRDYWCDPLELWSGLKPVV